MKQKIIFKIFFCVSTLFIQFQSQAMEQKETKKFSKEYKKQYNAEYKDSKKYLKTPQTMRVMLITKLITCVKNENLAPDITQARVDALEDIMNRRFNKFDQENQEMPQESEDNCNIM